MIHNSRPAYNGEKTFNVQTVQGANNLLNMIVPDMTKTTNVEARIAPYYDTAWNSSNYGVIGVIETCDRWLVYFLDSNKAEEPDITIYIDTAREEKVQAAGALTKVIYRYFRKLQSAQEKL